MIKIRNCLAKCETPGHFNVTLPPTTLMMLMIMTVAMMMMKMMLTGFALRGNFSFVPGWVAHIAHQADLSWNQGTQLPPTNNPQTQQRQRWCCGGGGEARLDACLGSWRDWNFIDFRWEGPTTRVPVCCGLCKRNRGHFEPRAWLTVVASARAMPSGPVGRWRTKIKYLITFWTR